MYYAGRIYIDASICCNMIGTRYTARIGTGGVGDKVCDNVSREYVSFLKCISFSIILLLLPVILIPAATAGDCCPDDDLEGDVEWVNCGSAAIAWGKTYELEVDNTHYILRTDDFDSDLSATSVSIEKGGEVQAKILFLNAQPEYREFQMDAELKVELTGITTDQYQTPSAHLNFYCRGRPALAIDIGASSETFGEITVSPDQYAPEKEKTITVDVSNSGEAWVENVELRVDIGELEFTGDHDLEFHDHTIFKNLGCMEKNSKASINFTVVAPAWDGTTSPYEINYNITALVGGFDIKGGKYDANNSINLSCTDPELRVVKRLNCDELNMSAGYITGAKVYSVLDYSVVSLGVYNIGFYTVGNLSSIDPPVPDDFVVVPITEDRNPVCVSDNSPYSTSYKLLPARPGSYTIDKVVASTNFYGTNFTWESGSSTITVHGPHIILSKSVKQENNGTCRVILNIHNDGDRAAWINLTDTVPADAGYIDGSSEQGIEGGTLPLGEWDLGVSSVNDSYLLTVTGVLLPPGESLVMSYRIHPDRFDELDLPYASIEFRARSNYRGVVRSSFWMSGAEVTQVLDLSIGKWITRSENPTGELWQAGAEVTQVFDPLTGEWIMLFENQTGELWQAVPGEAGVQVTLSEGDVNPLDSVLHNAPNSPVVLNGSTDMEMPMQQQQLTIGTIPAKVIEHVQYARSIIETIEKSAVLLIENSLYIVIILPVAGGFLIAYLLLRVKNTPP